MVWSTGQGLRMYYKDGGTLDHFTKDEVIQIYKQLAFSSSELLNLELTGQFEFTAVLCVCVLL